ncbi:MAG: glycerol-3-phosphate cytidylyltransferase [Omnitrophica bacterium RIFCSPLOWO2_01_FULL_45_10]|nr:MAG: glycerol-3-phosphate cytidylyltransferase [Omnitrophica bacterium RIFCSPLOWO2_01_FULL_45_10]
MDIKIKSLNKLLIILKTLKSKGKKIVFTNGCFDILHAGHVEYLIKSKLMGDILIVGLNSDSSVRFIKGPGRPINNMADRAKVLAALACVNYVTIFNEATPNVLIKKIRPDILAKGGDWDIKDIVGGMFVASYGGRVRRVPYIKGYSTSALIKRLKSKK